MKPWLPIWFTPRFLYLLGGIAVLLAASPGLPMLLSIAMIAAAALTVATLVDVVLGPRSHTIAVLRTAGEHFALRVPVDITYEVENRSPHAIAFGIMETPIRTLRFENEAAGTALPQSRAIASQSATPVARGRDELGTMYLWYENACGLLRRRVRIPTSQAIRVYPDLSAVERYGKMHARNRLIELGVRKMRLRGIGTEFESLREWTSGDPFRAIDWKATARRGKVMVAQYEVERSQNVMIVLDCGRLMTPRLGGQRKFDFAVTAALSVAAIAGLASDRVGAIAFARDILAAQAPRATHVSMSQLSEMLYDIEPRFEESDYAKAFAYLRSHLRKRSLIIFFTDVIDPQAQALVLAELSSLSRRHLVVCAFMNDEAIERALALAPSESVTATSRGRSSHETTTEADAYRAAVALGLRHERRAAAAMLAQRGILTIDVPARQLTTALINEYLRIKQRNLL